MPAPTVKSFMTQEVVSVRPDAPLQIWVLGQRTDRDYGYSIAFRKIMGFR